jgi:hypothetical protein
MIVPWVIVIGDRTHYYQLPGLTRWQVLSETPKQLRVQFGSAGKNLWQHKCYCVPSDQEWDEVNGRLRVFRESLNTIAIYLRRLGSYSQRLSEAGGIKKAPNPLTQSVICCKDPDTDKGGLTFNFPFQLNLYISRTSITAHTPKMLRYWVDGFGESIQLQTDMFVCPDDAAWEQFQSLREAAIAASNHLQDYLKQLGTYQEAKHDGRYNSTAHTNRLNEPTASETMHSGGVATAVEAFTSNGCDESTVGAGTKAISEVGGRSVLAELKMGDRVAVIKNWKGKDLHSKRVEIAAGDQGAISEVLPKSLYKVELDNGASLKFYGRQLEQISELLKSELVGDFKVGDRVRTLLNCFGELREATGVIVPIESNGTHGKVCLLPDVMPHQMGLEYACPLPPIEQIHSFYHSAYPVNGIHRGTTTVFRTNILEVLPSEPDILAIGDFVELYLSESGEALPEQQRRRGEVVQIFDKGFLRIRYRGEQFADKKDQVQRFRKVPKRDPLPYPTQPVQIASRGESVVVTAPDHPCYGETFTVHAISIFGAFREDNTFFYDEELGYRIEDDPYIQPVPADRDEAFTVTLEPGDIVQVLADDDLYEAIVTVYRTLPSFEIEIDYQGLLFAYPRHNLRLYERATPESLAYLASQHCGTTSTETALHQQREALLIEIEQIRQSGPVAPAGAEWKRYRKIKTVGKGDRAEKVTYPSNGGYYYTIWHRDAIFTNSSGKLVKSLQAGTNESDTYNDWQQRFERRRTIKQLQKTLDAIDRQLP